MFKHILLTAFIHFFAIIFAGILTQGAPRIYIREIDYNEMFDSDNYYAPIIKNILKLVKRDDPRLNSINKCILLSKSIDRKLRCVTQFDHEESQNDRYLAHEPFLDQNNNYLILSDVTEDQPFRSTFSEDYLDINDLIRTENGAIDTKPKIAISIHDNDEPTPKLANLRRFRSKIALRSKRKDDDSSASDEESSPRKTYSSESSGDKNSDENNDSADSEKDESVRNDEFKTSPKILYMQSPSRMYTTRRRLPHFLPKRFHWKEDDHKKLSNYWLDGPQGKYSGLYKTPY